MPRTLPRVAARLSDGRARASLLAALRGSAEVSFCRERSGLARLARRKSVAAVVVELSGDRRDDVVPIVAEIHGEFPSIPIVGYLTLSAVGAAKVAPAVRAGATAVVLAGTENLGKVLARMLRHDAESVSQRARRALIGVVPPSLRPIVAYCVRHAARKLTVEQLARALDVDRRTIAGRLAKAGFPSAERLIAWGRLLLASHLLEDQGRSVHQVAVDHLGLSSDSSFRATVERLTGLPVRAFRGPDALALALRRFREVLAKGAASRDPTGGTRARPARRPPGGAARPRPRRGRRPATSKGGGATTP